MRIFFIYLLVVFSVSLSAQSKYTISGYITEKNSGERLIGATIYNTTAKQSTVSNNYGFFSLLTNGGKCTIECHFMGYQKFKITLVLKSDTFLNIRLKKGLDIEEVKVTGYKLQRNNPELSLLSQPRIDIQMVESTPAILGENDALKTIQFLPGIKQGAENTAGFNVRGGSTDQNLILLDGVPLYNVNHLMGFFSIFNTDAIKNITLIKGGTPARYGGKLSSVLDITMKEGNLNEGQGTFSISPVSGRLTYEAPIKKDTGAFIVSLRRSFFDLPMMAFEKITGEKGLYGYYFYDINAKANWIFNTRNRLYFSIYTGKDNLFSNTRTEKNSNSRYRYRWGNVTSVLRWNKLFSPKLFSNFSVYYSHFWHNELGIAKEGNRKTLFKTSSILQDISLKSDFDYFVSPVYSIRFGAKVSQFFFNPNIIQLKTNADDIQFNQQNKTDAFQSIIYLENAFDFDFLAFNVGGRLSNYSTGKKNYFNIEPRFSANLKLTQHTAISFSYARLVQNLHLLTNSSLGMPTDIWVGATNKIEPQYANQVTLGLSQSLNKNISLNIEGYYKNLQKVVRFNEGITFLNPKQTGWEESIITGIGRAYGIECMAEKNIGKLTGFLSYTLSWSERRFNSLNSGKWFPFKYDRRHDISVLSRYQFKKSYNVIHFLSLGFTLQSGNNISLPDMKYSGLLLPGREYNTYHKPWEIVRKSYENPNNFKMPIFHHLDIGYNILKQKTDKKSVTWSFSVYNAYNRMNPWYYYKSNDKIKQVSLFPIIPSVGFKYVF
ncbi:MAG: hypothetical protein CSA36_00555 [Draconibacterium sp.]|nr:MAG: hypothetical protein CSA36_00555 [Draconibacterium sp.]